MRNTLLIARREFVENAKTKGFWIGIFIFPLIIAIGIGVQVFLARAESARHFVVVDQSGAFLEQIDRAVERLYQRSVLEALGRYVRENRRAELRQEIDLAAIPADGGSGTDQAAVEAFIAAGGQDAFLARVRPILEDGAPEFEAPSRTVFENTYSEPFQA